MTHLISYTFTQLQNNGILATAALDQSDDENKNQLDHLMKRGDRFSGYIYPRYNEGTIEELDEDGSALILFETSNAKLLQKIISIFVKCGHDVLEKIEILKSIFPS
jgi:hypothetical protein